MTLDPQKPVACRDKPPPQNHHGPSREDTLIRKRFTLPVSLPLHLSKIAPANAGHPKTFPIGPSGPPSEARAPPPPSFAPEGSGWLAFALDGLRRVGLRPESRQLFGLPSPVTGYGGLAFALRADSSLACLRP
jgi:hypothetical protein